VISRKIKNIFEPSIIWQVQQLIITQKMTNAHSAISTYRVLSQRSPESQLIKCQAFTACLLNSCTGSLCKPECCNFQWWNFINTNIIGYRPHHHCNLIFLQRLILKNKPIETVTNQTTKITMEKKRQTFPFVYLINLDKDNGGLLTLLMNNLLSITALKLLPVLRTRKR